MAKYGPNDERTASQRNFRTALSSGTKKHKNKFVFNLEYARKLPLELMARITFVELVLFIIFLVIDKI